MSGQTSRAAREAYDAMEKAGGKLAWWGPISASPGDRHPSRCAVGPREANTRAAAQWDSARRRLEATPPPPVARE